VRGRHRGGRVQISEQFRKSYNNGEPVNFSLDRFDQRGPVRGDGRNAVLISPNTVAQSLAEALARGMQISIGELKTRLQDAAAGGSFWTPEELAVLQR
jgi:hypothetical protein